MRQNIHGAQGTAMILEENARSTTRRSERSFVKTSHELSLINEARELKRCNDLNIRTRHVRALEYKEFREEGNELVTVPVPGSQTLFNKVWNETSIIARTRGKTVALDKLFSRAREIGEWLRLYHDTTEQPADARMVSLSLKDTFREKFDFVRMHKLMDDELIHALENRIYPEIESLSDRRYQSENHVRFCRVHGDFVAYNMVVDREWNIYIVDFADTHIGASIEDVGRFYELFWAISRTNAFRQEIFSEALDVFLGAYGVPAAIHASPFLRSVRALNVIIHLISEYNIRPFIARQVMTRWVLRRISRASLRGLTGESYI